MTAGSFAVILLEMASENEAEIAQYETQAAETPENQVEGAAAKIDVLRRRAEALRAGAASLQA